MEKILVLDFGGQYKELIASKIRHLNVYSEIKHGSISIEKIKEIAPIGIVLTGGPKSVFEKNSPKCDAQLFNLGIPILGICYGMQLMCHMLKGEVATAKSGEYGITDIFFHGDDDLLSMGVSKKSKVLMSHRDKVVALPLGFRSLASTKKCENALIADESRRLYGVQFHPEVSHTLQGEAILSNFVYKICGAKGDYTIDDYIERSVKEIREIAGNKQILLGLSGGVDSSVCAALIEKAVPGQLTCVFVDHGFMRKNEGDDIEAIFSNRNLTFIRINAEERFLAKLKGVTSPERKRKIIGNEFVAVFEEQSQMLNNIPFLAQGTIYPDIIESGDENASTIKSHHNVGGLPETMEFKGIIEPLRHLFKDEVRALGAKLGLPSMLTERQPFPGPGLAIRITGSLTKAKVNILREADAITCKEIEKLKNLPQQYFAVLTNTRSVGVKGDMRTYGYVVAVRAVTTKDFMTCKYADIPHRILEKIALRIVNEVAGVGRVVYDITGKPPGTVEWE